MVTNMRKRLIRGFNQKSSGLHLDFLPAALEVQETPPSPTGRCLVWIVVFLFFTGLAWAAVGEVDIVVSSSGRVMPSGRVKVVQAVEHGTVAAIRIREGDRVSRGQGLISLDPTYANADNERIRQQLADLLLHLGWRRAFAQWLAVGSGEAVAIELPRDVMPQDVARVEALYLQQREEVSALLFGLEKEKESSHAAKLMTVAELEKVEATLVILKERVTAHRALMEKQYGAKSRYLEMLQAQTELEKSMPVLKAKEQQLALSTSALDGRIAATLSEKRKNNLMELARLNSEATNLRQELLKSGRRQFEQHITAPVDGVVEELAVHTVGAVVTPAQVLMRIVPDSAVIEVEALVDNMDIGFIQPGQRAEVKVDAFNFTKYGLIDAKVADVSNDAVNDEAKGWVYKMRLELERDDILVEGKPVRLTPGMSVTAEVLTGKRRLIEFFLSPLLRYKNESVRER